MKKKIVCLVLAMLMVLPLLVGCSKDGTIDSINEEASRYTTTLNMWLITDSKLVADASTVLLSGITPKKEAHNLLTDAEKAALSAMTAEQKEAWKQVWQISEEINKLTKSKFKIQLNLKYVLRSEYYTALEAAFAKQKENEGVIVENKTEETILNEYGIPELKYPTVPDYQVDIMFLGNQQKYFNYAENGWLEDLKTQLEEASVSKLHSYVPTAYLQSAAIDGSVYALPNNHGVGEYVYLIADKQLMDDYNSSLVGASLYDTDFKEYLDYIYTTYAGVDDICPIYTENGKIELDFAHYWSFDLDSAPGMAVQKPDSFSIFGDSTTNKTKFDNVNLLSDHSYMTALATKTHYENTPNYITTDASKRAAVRVVRGGWEMRAEYEQAGYEVLVMQYPELTDEEIYASMFAVGKKSVSKVRSTEILAFLNTSAEVRNLLQYGVEGVNYTLESTTINGVTYQYAQATKGNLYEMNIHETGNVFIAHPGSAAEVLRWEYEKKQNLEMVYYPTLGLQLTGKLDEVSVRVLDAVSKKVELALDNMTTYDAVRDFYLSIPTNTENIPGLIGAIESCVKEYTGEDLYTNLTYTVNGESVAITWQVLYSALRSLQFDNGTGAVQSPYNLYILWCEQKGIK